MDVSAVQGTIAIRPTPLDSFERAVVSIAINESNLDAERGFRSAVGRFGRRLFGNANWRKRQGFANEQFEQLRCYICLLREGDTIAASSLRMQLIEHGYPNGKLVYIDHWAIRSR